MRQVPGVEALPPCIAHFAWVAKSLEGSTK